MKTKNICITALGVALYVCVSTFLKIPIINHISLDLGYVVLAVYCYNYGAVSGAIVGGFGAVLVSMLFSGWFPPGWMLGNIFIGAFCGSQYRKSGIVRNMLITVFSVAIGVWIIKTSVECALYGIPVSVKLVSNSIAAITDAFVMCFGLSLLDFSKLMLERK